MSVQLLDKTRKINQLLHKSDASKKVVFSDICLVLSENLASNIVVISKKGKILGIASRENEKLFISGKIGTFIDSMLNDRLLSILSTKENVNLETLGFEGEDLWEHQAIVSPIEIGGERLGTVFVYKTGRPYGIDDIILSEYGTTVVGLAMIRAVQEEMETERRKQDVVESALASLSYSEIDAILHIFEAMDGDEGVLIASKVADKVGITRSVIVNAIRKLESAGVIVSRSSGMKGTYIKVVNPYIYEEIKKYEIEKNSLLL